jgi:hypothetical protein
VSSLGTATWTIASVGSSSAPSAMGDLRIISP